MHAVVRPMERVSPQASRSIGCLRSCPTDRWATPEFDGVRHSPIMSGHCLPGHGATVRKSQRAWISASRVEVDPSIHSPSLADPRGNSNVKDGIGATDNVTGRAFRRPPPLPPATHHHHFGILHGSRWRSQPPTERCGSPPPGDDIVVYHIVSYQIVLHDSTSYCVAF